MPAKLRWCTACRRVTPRPTGNYPFVKGQLTYAPASMHQTRSPHCFRYGINEQILLELGMHSDIERFVEAMPIVMIQMWIAPISYSNRSAAVITEAIEVDSKPFKSILPFEISVTCACINKFHCIPCL